MDRYGMVKKYKSGLLKAGWLIPSVIFTFAFTVRMAFVMQVKDCVYWRIPVVDALTYHESANEMLDVGWLAPYVTDDPEYAPYAPYYQPPFYQVFLALVYLLSDRSVMTAIILQYLIGSLCCALTYVLGRRLFDRRTGIAAGVAMALTASQIYYEGRLLPPVLLIFFNLAIILLATKQLKSPATWRWPVIGLLTGLSAITRPDILLFVPALLFWMWMERAKVLTIKPVAAAALVLAPIALVVGMVTARNYFVGRDTVLISYNGGINAFIGNHPQMEKTLGTRPGIRWEAIEVIPMIRTGIRQPSKWDRYLYKQTLKNMFAYKRIALSNLTRKFVWVWRGPEIRRNEDDYYLTRVSSLYRLLLWRKGNFGFPFGIIAPLGLVGMLMSLRRKRELFLLYAYIVTQILMLVAFFPCSRYRVPMTPILLMFGAAATFEIIDLARRKQFGEVVPLLFAVGAFGVMSTLCPPRFEGTPSQIEAENYRLIANCYYEDNQIEAGIQAARKGVELEPKDPDLHRWLLEACILHKDYAGAEKEALTVIKLVPSYTPVYQKLLQLYEATGQLDKAAKITKYLKTLPQLTIQK